MMGIEKEKVLEMVADGTITAAEGMKLLDALGSAGRNSNSAGSKTAKRRGASDTSSMIQEIGSVIQATIGDALKSQNTFEKYRSSDLEEVKTVSESVEEGADLVIHGSAERGAVISIVLLRSEDNTLKATLDGDGFIKTGGSSNRKVLRWDSGELTVHVPDCMNSVKVLLKGGGISSTGVKIPIELKTMGGGIVISRPGDSFSIKTMGGGLDISLDNTWKGDSRAKTMGGGVSVHLESGTSASIHASTLGGSISVSGDNYEMLSDSGNSRGKSKMSVSFGEKGKGSELSVVSMGGGIVIEGVEDE